MFKSGKKATGEIHSLLRIEGPSKNVWLVDLVGEEYTLGRGDPLGTTKVDFQVPDDEYLSRAHFRVFRVEDHYEIENLSPNGTLVNGTAIEKPVRLKGKEKIEAGEATTATYLLVTTEERRKLYEEQSGIKERREETGGTADAPAKKPFYAKPIFLAVLVFYAVLMVVVLGLVKEDDTKIVDPGEGPYFTALLTSDVAGSRPEGDAQAQADRMWEAALAKHGGRLLAEGGHAYALVLAARKVAGVMGYTTLAQALEKGESFAQRAKLALDDLEDRIAILHAEGDGYVKGRHWQLAYDTYARMAAAVPDTRAPVRRFAVHRMAKLRKMM